MKGRVLAGLCAVLAWAGPVVAAETAAWRIDRGDVKILVPLRPGGAFTATTASMNGTLSLAGEKPARLAGEIAVALASIDTGIALRNQHLREKYLEVAKGPGFDTAVVSDIRFREADGEAYQGSSGFTGALLLHGVKHAIDGTADIRHQGNDRRVKAVFSLVMSEFGITAPMYLGVGVADKLLVTVEFLAVRAQVAK